MISHREKKKYKSKYFQENKEEIYRKKKERESKWPEERKEEEKRKRYNSIIKKRYGISLDDVDALFQIQKGRCFICNGNFFGKDKLIQVIDHNHNTGKVRGLLCQKCNSALGLFGDDLEILKKAKIA
jgi:transposase